VPSSSDAVHQYHDGTKHHFRQFARSLGYLDWATQPHPFRSFADARVFPVFPSPDARRHGYSPRDVSFDALFNQPEALARIDADAIGDLLRHSLGLSAWKQFREERRGTTGDLPGDLVERRWSLRVNPSSGNLHPTEAYVACGHVAGLAGAPAVYHYAADRHALELRALLSPAAWAAAAGGREDFLLLALTSIHWRESWKYGERAFRYCQHDLGHAVAAIVASAAAVGWQARLLPAWSHNDIGALAGVDRDEDFADAEREEPGCVLAVGPGARGLNQPGAEGFVAAAKSGVWTGRASQLSEDHVQWTFIDRVSEATRDEAPGRTGEAGRAGQAGGAPGAGRAGAGRPAPIDARHLFLKRRSAVAFDGTSSVDREAFLGMLAGIVPGDGPPWDALWWRPRIHLALFVHRVDGVEPGLYLLVRDSSALDSLRRELTRDFLWAAASDEMPLFCLAKGDCRRLAERVSCDQAIAGDGFFSLGMIAEFDRSLGEYGPSFYRHLFWESGFVGQFLYLEAEAAGARATGIGCFYDDPVHDVLGLHGHAFQSLYHFTIGVPVEDARLTTEAGYRWESGV
jgi:SagB-type dehydrogenase family enzyme